MVRRVQRNGVPTMKHDYPPPDFDLAAKVLLDEPTAAYVMACMNLGHGVRLLCELKRPPEEIHKAVADCIQRFGDTSRLTSDGKETDGN